MKTNNKLALLTIIVGLTLMVGGCTTHSMLNIADTTSLTRSEKGKVYPPYSGKVFFTDVVLPSTVTYAVVGQVDGYKATTASTEDLLIIMAKRCRTNGANAVINLKTWRQMAGWSYSAPQGSGTAIRVADTNALAGLQGYWF